jgi:hypothetical protein
VGSEDVKQTFSEWMAKVDTWLYKKCGLDHNCLADYCYRDAYDNGEHPATIGKRVLEQEGFYE